MKLFGDTVKELSNLYNVKTQAIMGNHELFDISEFDYNVYVKRYKEAMGYDAVDFHFKVNGFHFIMYSPRDADWQYDEDNLAPWIEQQIQEALNDDPIKTKPIFVLQHYGFKDTTYRTDMSYMKRTDSGVVSPARVIPAILRKYPQVVNFSGHTHGNINDPRSVYQKDFTAITTGTLCYYNLDCYGFHKDKVFSKDRNGHLYYSTIDPIYNDDGGQFIIFETDKTGASKMMVMEANSGLQIGEPFYFRSFASTKDFRYTPDRANTDPVAEFDNPFISEPTITKNSVLYKITHAKYAQNYRLDLFKKGSTTVTKTEYRFSDSWYSPQPLTFDVDFNDLTADTEYQIKVTPVNSWGKEGKPLSLEFKTDES